MMDSSSLFSQNKNKAPGQQNLLGQQTGSMAAFKYLNQLWEWRVQHKPEGSGQRSQTAPQGLIGGG